MYSKSVNFVSLNITLIILAILVIMVHAAPLNINMGAYSPALVVGDGAIALQGSDQVTKVINSLEGAGVDGSGAGAGDGASDDEGAGGVQAGLVNPGSRNGIEGLGRKVVPSAPKP
ncbi:putative effector protein [Erysiphe neolycopersici]|uniref:Putative effector protein n=1 Tax=Erysiphe neolycopersici TaxID=212602 RepID=A0A420HXI1_9PEZI|nr:putative effector protein [Erysiphe neolycopersici]